METTYRDRDLNFFVTSRFISTPAIQVQSVAIGWQIYEMERTPLALGLVGACESATSVYRSWFTTGSQGTCAGGWPRATASRT